ncbi:hypothetical protein SFC43_17505 [Bacteroides sp. CR5/BHMF/2]|nr:hypothetical protein [Bacteroides sp. CR5/BHMF/2]
MDLHVLAEISAVRGVAQQKQVFVAYQGTELLGAIANPSSLLYITYVPG